MKCAGDRYQCFPNYYASEHNSNRVLASAVSYHLPSLSVSDPLLGVRIAPVNWARDFKNLFFLVLFLLFMTKTGGDVSPPSPPYSTPLVLLFIPTPDT